MCNSHSGMLQYSSETLRKSGVNWSIHPKRGVRKALFSTEIWSRRYELPVHAAIVSGEAVTTINPTVNSEVKLRVMNARSVGNKLDYVFDHIIDNNLDIVALTETYQIKKSTTDVWLWSAQLMVICYITFLGNLVVLVAAWVY